VVLQQSTGQMRFFHAERQHGPKVGVGIVLQQRFFSLPLTSLCHCVPTGSSQVIAQANTFHSRENNDT
jgi:hypothetical protein